MTAPVNGAFAAALVDELAAVIAALVDTTAASTAAGIGTGPQWVATIEAEGLPDGCSLAFDDAGATALAAQMLGTPDAATREAVLDTLREILAKAVSGIAMKPIAHGARLVVTGIAEVPHAEGSAAAVSRTMTVGTPAVPLTLTAWGQPAFAADADGDVASARTRLAESAKGVPQERIDVILDIELPLVVRFGRTELPLKTLMRLGPGSVIDLGRSPDEPVEIVVSNRVVARGEVVIVANNYGIRIVDVASQTERMRSLEG